MLVLFLAAALLSQDPEPALDCDNAMTTLDVNACMAKEVEAEEARMNAYLEAAILHVREASDSPELGASAASEMAEAQTAWEAYVKAECGAVYTHWQGGTVRVAMALACERRLTYGRTRHLWETYLTYVDSTPPILPEPLPLADENRTNTDD